MHVQTLLAALLAAVPLMAPAQSEAPLHLGVPGDMTFVQPSAFTIVNAEGPTLVMFPDPGFFPVILDYINLAPPEGITVSLCGTEFPPIQPTAQMASGRMDIPMGDAGTARRAADVMAGLTTCDDFTVPDPAVTIADLLPSPPASGVQSSGLTIRSPTDTYDAMAEEVMEARVTVSPYTGGHVIDLTFGPGLAAWFGVETGEHLGEPIELLVCGTLLTAPTVQEAITGGEVQVTGNFPKSEAEEIAARIRGDISCDG